MSSASRLLIMIIIIITVTTTIIIGMFYNNSKNNNIITTATIMIIIIITVAFNSSSVLSQEKMKLWVSTVKEWYPSLATQTYFVPPVVFNRVPFSTRNVCGVDVKVQEPIKQLSDVREGEAQQRVQHVLFQLLGEREETMVVVWRLDFDSYLNIPKGTSRGGWWRR